MKRAVNTQPAFIVKALNSDQIRIVARCRQTLTFRMFAGPILGAKTGRSFSKNAESGNYRVQGHLLPACSTALL